MTVFASADISQIDALDSLCDVVTVWTGDQGDEAL